MGYINKFAEEHGCCVKIIAGSVGSQKKNNEYSTVNPCGFVELLLNASYVFVTSFHGLAFSLLLGKEVYASFFSNSNRAETLLSLIGASERLIQPMKQIPYLNPIDYNFVKEHLDNERLRTMSLLCSYIEK